jgi:hypothetical protein
MLLCTNIIKKADIFIDLNKKKSTDRNLLFVLILMIIALMSISKSVF